MPIIKTEKTTQTILGIFAVVSLIIYTLASLGIKYDYTKYVIIIVGFVLGIVLILEAGVFTYFQTKSYRKITFGDLVIFVTTILAGGVFLNSLLLINAVKEQIPLWLQTFAQSSGTIIGIVGLIVALFFMLTPRIR